MCGVFAVYFVVVYKYACEHAEKRHKSHPSVKLCTNTQW